MFLLLRKTLKKNLLKNLQTFVPTNILIHSDCGVSLPALNHLGYWRGRQRTPIRDSDRLGNHLQWVTSFLSCCSWMFTEQLRKKSELVHSEEIHQV